MRADEQDELNIYLFHMEYDSDARASFMPYVVRA